MKKKYYQSYQFIEHQEVNDEYIRLLGLPPALQFDSSIDNVGRLGWLVTLEGGLMMVSKSGLREVLPDLPPIKEIVIENYSSSYMLILDRSNNLRFATIDHESKIPIKLSSHIIPEVETFDEFELSSSIRHSILHTDGRISVLYNMEQTAEDRGYYKPDLRQVEPPQYGYIGTALAGGCIADSGGWTHVIVSSRDKLTLKSIDWNANIKEIACNVHNSILIVLREGNELTAYYSSSSGESLYCDRTRKKMKINHSVNISRLMTQHRVWKRDRIVVEDTDGVLHSILERRRIELPCRLFNPDCLRGQFVKSARNR